MEIITFDNGIKTYKINDGGELQFNPSDPNLYARFLDAVDKIQNVEKDMHEKAKALPEGEDTANGAALVRILADGDQQIKELLNGVFGGKNDFDKIVEGVNLLGVAGNGERVVVNLINALTPILMEGAKNCVDGKVAKAKENRAQRRAKK